MAAETGFTIDDRIYEVPAIDTFNMDEAQILYDYSGITIEDFANEEDDTARFKNPGFMRALMHIAYQRAHPDVKPAKVRELVSKANILAALATLSGDEEEDASPPVLTSAPDEPSQNGSDTSSEISGRASTTDSDGQGSQPVPIGISKSGTSSPASTRATSAV